MKFAVGDSHVAFFAQSNLTKSYWMGCTYTATIYQLLEKGLNIFNLKEEVLNSAHYIDIGIPDWQCTNGIFNTPNIDINDEIIFCYGFNDIQKNIYKYSKENPEGTLNFLLEGYIRTISRYIHFYKIKCSVLSIPPVPLPSPIEGKYNNGIFGDFEALGSDEERIEYTKYANKILENLCIKNDIKFINIYNIISDDNGFIKKEYTTDYVHLDSSNIELKNKISERLSAL